MKPFCNKVYANQSTFEEGQDPAKLGQPSQARVHPSLTQEEKEQMKVDGKAIVKSCQGRDRTQRRTISSYWKCRFCEKEMEKAGVGQLI